MTQERPQKDFTQESRLVALIRVTFEKPRNNLHFAVFCFYFEVYFPILFRLLSPPCEKICRNTHVTLKIMNYCTVLSSYRIDSDDTCNRSTVGVHTGFLRDERTA